MLDVCVCVIPSSSRRMGVYFETENTVEEITVHKLKQWRSKHENTTFNYLETMQIDNLLNHS